MFDKFQFTTLDSVCKDLIHLITKMHQIWTSTVVPHFFHTSNSTSEHRSLCPLQSRPKHTFTKSFFICFLHKRFHTYHEGRGNPPFRDMEAIAPAHPIEFSKLAHTRQIEPARMERSKNTMPACQINNFFSEMMRFDPGSIKM